MRYNSKVNHNANLYKTMLLIRRFEERLIKEFATGKISGTTHTYIGQEADAAGIFCEIQDEDIIFSNHRCHGHFLAYGGDPYRLAAELQGKATGLVGGRGGSQHIHYRNFYTNGIQGGIVPIATGMAFAEKVLKSGRIAVVFIGDGTLGEGILYESINIASLWDVPILFVLENNRYAQTTPIATGVAGSIARRFQAFGLPIWEDETSDVLKIQELARKAIQHVRFEQKPGCLILHTYRFAAHSKGDDIRSREELDRIQNIDPIKIHAGRLEDTEKGIIEAEVDGIVNDAFTRADNDPFPLPLVEEK